MNITITSSHQNPADFSCSVLDALNLDEGYEVAVTKVFHAPIFNVTERNNRFTLAKPTPVHSVSELSTSVDEEVRHLTVSDYYIPPGFYPTSCDILAAIHKVLVDKVELGHNHGASTLIENKPILSYSTTSPETMTLKIVDKKVKFLIDKERDGDSILLSLLGYCFDEELSQLVVENYPFEISSVPGFLYSNIVENSFINQQRSRLLSIFPVSSKQGYNCYEVMNPIYSPLSAHSFIDVTFKLLDIHGETLKMDPVYTSWYGTETVLYPTIISLHIRKML